MKVGIVGAGFGGCATALALARDGHEVTVLEAAENPGPVGAGIMLQPSGMMVLAELGLLGPILEHGVRCDRLRCVSEGGRLLFDLPYATRDPSLYGLGLHRGALFHVLYTALRPAGVTVELGVVAARVDGAHVVDEAGARHGPYDLVVVADGARSRLRTFHGHARRVDEYPWGALWFVADDSEGRYRGELLQCVNGAEQMLGLLPTGTSPADPTPRVSLFVSVRLDRVDALRARGLEALKDDCRRLAPMSEPVLGRITSFDELLVASYRDVRMDRLDFGRIAYVGDAAHAMSPQLGQGSNLALLDAMELARSLRTHGSVERALPAYSRARRSQLRFYQWMTRTLTPFFQGDSRLLGAVRDVFFPIGARLPIVRGEMIATMCGVKQGVVGRPLALPRGLLALPG
ncbi:MAG: NAD(P)/FAD-dependent oxidoreductase [Polyangiales bacterium]